MFSSAVMNVYFIKTKKLFGDYKFYFDPLETLQAPSVHECL